MAGTVLLGLGGNAMAYSVTETEPSNVQSQANAFVAAAGDADPTITGDLHTQYAIQNGGDYGAWTVLSTIDTTYSLALDVAPEPSA